MFHNSNIIRLLDALRTDTYFEPETERCNNDWGRGVNVWIGK